jgi:hypothetical protein
MEAKLGGTFACGNGALAESLGDIGGKRWQDQEREGRLAAEKSREGRHHDHRHRKADRAFDESRKEGDQGRKHDQ